MPKIYNLDSSQLNALDINLAAELLAYSVDLVLIVDKSGVIERCIDGSKPISSNTAALVGKKWLDTVAIDSQPKVNALLKTSEDQDEQKWRQVNQEIEGSISLPIQYSTIFFANQNKLVAIGKDLSSIATLQQKLVESQQEIERDYANLHAIQNRYLQLFNSIDQAYLIVDSQTLKIVEVNKSAGFLVGDLKKVQGKLFVNLFPAKDHEAIQSYLMESKAGILQSSIQTTLENLKENVEISSTILREGNQNICLVSIKPKSHTANLGTVNEQAALLSQAMEDFQDGFIVCSSNGVILTTNNTFVSMSQSTQKEGILGKSLEIWLGRASVDLKIILGTVREHGSIKDYASTITADDGSSPIEVRISAVGFNSSKLSLVAIGIHQVSKAATQVADKPDNLGKNAKELTQLVGKVPLKQIVTETTDIIEKLCILAALDLTMTNRASAAELLGLSRQGLYIKMRRFGIVDSNANDDVDA
ncbi:transcriptional regulator PpsR [Polynucleobacter sp. 15G-AUS-farblos]|uniref:transcriptional regulator PpsR n=1 Tax=Polynucleobacter sp. 15G-AUS-farblos TaxID=2689094 RepID=UPI001C0D54BD|nr:transcriptional regulator PpsR [Polynucleobacter sp. 15G-AUS-farblos]